MTWRTIANVSILLALIAIATWAAWMWLNRVPQCCRVGSGSTANVASDATSSAELAPPPERDESRAEAARSDSVRTVATTGVIAGRVRGDEAIEIEGARVRWSLSDSQFDVDRAGEVVTDAHGTFRIESLAPGDYVLVVTAPHHTSRLTFVPVVAGSVHMPVITLPPSVRLVGTARDAAGRPLVGVGIEWGREDESDEAYGVITAEEGSYSITTIPAGVVYLRAFLRGIGRAQEHFVLEPGETARWDPVLGAEKSASGVVLDEEDRALAGWIVVGRDPQRVESDETTRTDASGRFELRTLLSDRIALHVYEPDGDVLKRPLLVADTAWGTTDLTLRVQSILRATSWVVGRLVDGRGAPVKDAWISIGDEEDFWRDAPDARGRFRSGPLRSGRFSIVFGRGEDVLVSYYGLSLGDEQEYDLGDVVLRPTGRLVVRPSFDHGRKFDARGARAVVQDAKGREVESWSSGALVCGLGAAPEVDWVLEWKLAPGSYRVELSGKFFQAQTLDAKVEESAETLLEPALEIAWERSLVVTVPRSEERSLSAHVVVRAADGTAHLDQFRTYFGVAEITVDLHHLGAGTYSYEVTAENDLSAKGTFSIAPEQALEDTVRIELHSSSARR